MGGSSKEQTVGYKYHVGIHMILSTGVADSIHSIEVDEKLAFRRLRPSDDDLTFTIDKEDLFGGESREGGILGDVDFEKGAPTQGVNAYLASVISGIIPAYRGVVGLVLNHMYIGTNPYLKKWRIRFQRLHRTSDDELQWYDSKSSIFIGEETDEVVVNDSDTFHLLEYHPRPEEGVDDVVTFDGDVLGPISWSGQGNNSDGTGDTTNSFVGEADFTDPHLSPRVPHFFPSNFLPEEDIGANVELSKTFTLSKDTETLRVYGLYTRDIKVFLDGLLIFEAVDQQKVISLEFDVFVDGTVLGNHKAGDHTILMTSTAGDEYLYTVTVNHLAVRVESVAHGYEAMNPIHIIRECLTDQNWGMGYDSADIDNTSFTEAADVLHDVEKIGLCIRWERQEAIEKFITKIKKHINAELYVDRITGLFTIKLIRPDYDVNLIPSLSEANTTKITNFSRSTFGELTNSVTVKYYDMDVKETGTITVQDIALAAEQGNTIVTTLEYKGFPNAEMASRAAQRDLVTLSTPLVACTVYTSATEHNFNLGGVFKLSWAKYGLTDLVMRITGLNLGDGKNNIIKMECIQDVFTAPLTSLIPNTEVLWVDPNSAPVPIVNIIGIELPYFELVQIDSQTQVDNVLATNSFAGYVGAAASRPINGINAIMNTDAGDGFKEAGVLDYCPSASLLNDIDKTQKTITLSDINRVASVPLGTWFQIGDELLSIETYPDGGGAIDVKRGLLDTVPATHLAQASMLFWDEWSQVDPVEYVASDVVDVKAVNVTPVGVSDLNQALVSTVTLDSRAVRPYPSGNLELNGQSFPADVSGDIVVTWTSRNRLQQTSGILLDYYEGSVTSEAGVTYDVYLKQGVTVIDSDLGLTALTTTFAGNVAGNYTLLIETIRDGFSNFQVLDHNFDYAPDILVNGIASAESFGTASLIFDQVLTPTGITSGESFGITTVS